MERSFPKAISSLDSVFAFIAEFAEGHRIGDAVLNPVNLSIEELFVNLVKYNKESRNDISIHVTLRGTTIEVSLTDRDVHEFDVRHAQAIDPGLPIHERRTGGMGLHLVNELMDEVQYEFADGVSTVTIYKKLES